MGTEPKYNVGDTVWFVDEFFFDDPDGEWEYRPFSGTITNSIFYDNGDRSVLLDNVPHRPTVHATEGELVLTESEAQVVADTMNKERKHG